MKKMPKKPRIKMEQVPFLGVLFLFAGFSLYGILSFNSSLTDHVDDLHASVLVAAELAPEYYTFEAFAEEEVFSDVKGSHPNSVAIAYFKQEGFIGGYDDGTFKAENGVNRAEAAKIINEVIDFDFNGGIYEDCFPDCVDQWFEAYVCAAAEQGWVGGFSDGKFYPTYSVTKMQALKMGIMALDLEFPSVSQKPYGDVDLNTWMTPYAAYAKANNVVTGSLFYPNEELNRASFVQLLYDVIKSSE